MSSTKHNEREWAGQIVYWLNNEIGHGRNGFQQVTNDRSLKVSSKKTKFPDILVFIDKFTGIIFNGWELKFPDTPVDDSVMLDNALEKAKAIRSESFVTWNGAEAILWGIDTTKYSRESLTRLKVYPKDPSINSREDLANPSKYNTHELNLRKRAIEILNDLWDYYTNQRLRAAINVSGEISESIMAASDIVIAEFSKSIKTKCARNAAFNHSFHEWEIKESATIQILKSNSRGASNIDTHQVLARFMFYNLIGRTLFYMVLSESVPTLLVPIDTTGASDAKVLLNRHFNDAKTIDYQALFQPDFTDSLPFSQIASQTIFKLLDHLSRFSFRSLPESVVGHVLENLVPVSERIMFGQYFTPEVLADLVAFPAISQIDNTVWDPTCGTGTFLTSFYGRLSKLGLSNHSDILQHIWGNDISHFPAILSVINLYKQNVEELNNFPQVTREDLFNLKPGDVIKLPDPQEINKKIDVEIPLFDGIATNLPFIQYEDIPKQELNTLIKGVLPNDAALFANKNRIKSKSDYFTYCLYYSSTFLKENGVFSAITSNAWLGTDYGLQFKKFLINHFHIKYIVQTTAEHWFKNSSVVTIYMVLQKNDNNDKPTKFVSVHKRIYDLFDKDDLNNRLQQIEEFYTQLEFCDDQNNVYWKKDQVFTNVYNKKDGSCSVSIIDKDTLVQSISKCINWAEYFISGELFAPASSLLTKYNKNIIDIFRGEKTFWDPMFIIQTGSNEASSIDSQYLFPCIKTPKEITTIRLDNIDKFSFFICKEDMSNLDQDTKSWINRFVEQKNSNKSKTVPDVCSIHKPFWYSIQPKKASLFSFINPGKRFIISYSETPVYANQRLICMNVKDGYDLELVCALLNSSLSFLMIEMRGSSRSEGVLDFSKESFARMEFLNPALLNATSKKHIIQAFRKIINRPVLDIDQELQQPDRIAFDKTVFKEYGLSLNYLKLVYQLLIQHVNDRTTMKSR